MGKYYPGMPDDYNFRQIFDTAVQGTVDSFGNLVLSGSSADAVAVAARPPEYAFYRLPAPQKMRGQTVYVRDIGIDGSYWFSNGVRWAPLHGGRIVLANQTYQVDDATDATTSNIVLMRYTAPPLLFAENSTLVLDAKASWPGSTTQKNLRAYIGTSQWATTNNGGSATILSAKWSGLSLQNRNSAFAQIGEAAGTAGGQAQQAAAFLTTTANTHTGYREITIQANWSTAGAGSNKIILESARLELVWGA